MKKIVIIGAGYTGLSAAYQLLKRGLAVTILEKGKDVGGLASSFKVPKWDWRLEKYYHHWFTNDDSVLNLAKEIGHNVITIKPNTDLFYQNSTYPFDSPLSILNFPHFSWTDKVRLGLAILYLKLSSDYRKFDNTLAMEWIEKYMGKRASRIVWEPLFRGKFGEHKDKILLTWFWARIKKRTPRLAYPEGGFASFTETLVKKIEEMGGEILTSNGADKIRQTPNGFTILTDDGTRLRAAKILVTTPSFLLPRLFPHLSLSYKKKLLSTRYLSAQVLVLRLKKKLMDKTYWLSMGEQSSPFLAVVEHTNFMNPKHYSGEHIVYVGNYLPDDHPYLTMRPQNLLKIFDPQLRRIRSDYKRDLIETHVFSVPGAQPIVESGYAKRIPKMKTPIKNVYLANMAMVYPWDRGTNYAVEYGEHVARLIARESA